MANDYNGYIATYREYQRGDHYRKALTGWGPHSSDYLATRLVYIGRQMQRPGVLLPADSSPRQLLAPKIAADLAVNDARGRGARERPGGASIDAYEAVLPDDAREPGPVTEPDGRRALRRGAVHLERRLQLHRQPGGRVQRETGDGWVTYADQSGELPVTLEFPQGTDVPAI